MEVAVAAVDFESAVVEAGFVVLEVMQQLEFDA